MQVKEEMAQEEDNKNEERSSHIFNEIENINHLYTQKQVDKEELNLIESFGDINKSMKLAPYSNYLNYSQTMTRT